LQQRVCLQKHYERAEESWKICKYNLENQKKKLNEINMQIVKVEELLSTMLLPADEYRTQLVVHKKLKLKAWRLSGLIKELEGEFELAEKNLRRIEKNLTA
jgi:hypothetical protein